MPKFVCVNQSGFQVGYHTVLMIKYHIIVFIITGEKLRLKSNLFQSLLFQAWGSHRLLLKS